jgi:hypothetical protein
MLFLLSLPSSLYVAVILFSPTVRSTVSASAVCFTVPP